MRVSLDMRELLRLDGRDGPAVPLDDEACDALIGGALETVLGTGGGGGGGGGEAAVAASGGSKVLAIVGGAAVIAAVAVVAWLALRPDDGSKVATGEPPAQA